jgi:hypothetical protein
MISRSTVVLVALAIICCFAVVSDAKLRERECEGNVTFNHLRRLLCY